MEFRNQKKPNSKPIRTTRIPTVASVVEQVAEQTVPGFSFLGWLRSFFGTQQKQQQQPQQSQQSQQSQEQQEQQEQQQQQQQQQSQESEQSRLLLSSQSRPQRSQTSTSPGTILSIDAEMERATEGDAGDESRRSFALTLFNQLTSDKEKRKFLTRYKNIIMNYDQGGEREVALGNFNEELEVYLNQKSRAASQPSPYARIPSTTEAAVIAASDSGAGVFPNRGGSRTRKHKRKHHHSK